MASRDARAGRHPVSLLGLQYELTFKGTPGQQLIWHVAKELGKEKVPGKYGLRLGVNWMMTPIQLHELTLSKEDHGELLRWVRAFAMVAFDGDEDLARRAWTEFEDIAPFVSPRLAKGEAFFIEPEAPLMFREWRS